MLLCFGEWWREAVRWSLLPWVQLRLGKIMSSGSGAGEKEIQGMSEDYIVHGGTNVRCVTETACWPSLAAIHSSIT